jgi:hypothetical protein
MPLRVRRVLVAPVLAATILLASACGGEPTDDPAGSAGAGTTSPAGASGTAPRSGEPPTSASSDAATQTITLSYANGEASGDTGRVAIPLGTTVTVVVRGDSADKVHVHGYDRYLEVPAGSSATLTFTADIPGVFDVELHDTGLLLTQLEVS